CCRKLHIVEAAVQKDHGVGFYERLKVLAASAANHAAHLKNVHEVGVERQLDLELLFAIGEVLKAKGIEEGIAGQHLLAAQMDGIFRDVQVVFFRNHLHG